MERPNEEIRHREHVIRICPNGASVERLVAALLLEQHEIWSTGPWYFDKTAYWEWRRLHAVVAD